MARKIYDLAVAVGQYSDRDGQTKARWQTVGVMMEREDGGRFILLERTFNPAGVVNPDGRETLLISMFPPKQRDGGYPQPAPAAQSYHQPAPAPATGAQFDDEIPF
jgi:hypothetical protein